MFAGKPAARLRSPLPGHVRGLYRITAKEKLMKKKVLSKLRLSKETLHNMADRALEEVVGGSVRDTICCPTLSQSVDPSCPQTWRCC
jgi:hypothetical protein